MTDATTTDRASDPPEQLEGTGGSGLGMRGIAMSRVEPGAYEVTNSRGGTLQIGSGQSDHFTPVELLLTAIAGCSAVDVDAITGRRAAPTAFDVTATGVKSTSEDLGNHLRDIEVVFTVRFPDGDDGDRAREMLPKAVRMSRDRLCTVSRAVQLATPVTMEVR